MKINDIRKSVSIGELNPGEVFVYGWDHYIVTDEFKGEKKYCVNLKDGFLVPYSIHDTVFRCSAEVVVN